MKMKISEKLADKVTDAVTAGIQVKEEINAYKRDIKEQKRREEERRRQEEAMKTKKMLKFVIPIMCALFIFIGIMSVFEDDNTPQEQKAVKAVSSEVQEPEEKKKANTESKSVQEQRLNKEKAEIRELQGKNLYAVKETLAKKRYTAVYYFDNATGADNEFNDYTGNVNELKDNELKQWVATEIKTIDPEKRKAVIRINTADNIQAEKEREIFKEKFPAADAWIALENYGEKEFPYGFDLHYTFGRLAEEPMDEDTWYLKAEATIKNAYGTEMDVVCEGEISGTPDSPAVEYFHVNE